MAVKGLTKNGLKRIIHERGSVRDGFLIYIHGKTPDEAVSLNAKMKLHKFLSDKLLFTPILELLNDKVTLAILIEDDNNLGTRLAKTLIFDYGLFNNDIGFIIYKIKCYRSMIYEVTK